MNLDDTLGIPLSPSVLPRPSTAKRLRVFISGAVTDGRISVRDYSFPSSSPQLSRRLWQLFDLWTKYKRFNRLYHKYYKKSNINVYILISSTRQFLISLNPHTLVLFISVKKSREEKINKSTDFLIGFFVKNEPHVFRARIYWSDR